MQITPDALNHLFYNFDLSFNRAFTSYTPQYPQITMTMPSTTKENKYPMRNILPRMREWVGERVVQNAGAQEYSIVNKSYEATIAVQKEDIEDDNLGLYNIDAETLGNAAAVWPDQVVFDLLKDGENVQCYDGQNFFDTDHPALYAVNNADASTISNVIEVDQDAKGRIVTFDNLSTAIGGASSWLNDRGEPLGINFNMLVVPGQRDIEAHQAMAAFDQFGATNVLAGRYTVMVVPRLNNRPDEFYLMDTTRPIKPMIWQSRKAPEFVSLVNPTDENVFWRKEYIYGVDARGNAGFGLWFLALKIKKAA